MIGLTRCWHQSRGMLSGLVQLAHPWHPQQLACAQERLHLMAQGNDNVLLQRMTLHSGSHASGLASSPASHVPTSWWGVRQPEAMPKAAISSATSNCRQHHRPMSTVSDPTDVSSKFKSFMQPDVHDPFEAQLAKHWITAHEAIGFHITPRAWSAGWTVALGDRLDLFWNKFDTWFACFRSIKGFSTTSMIAEASGTFRAVSAAVASQQPGKLQAVNQLVVPKLLQQMRVEADKTAASASQHKVKWQLVELSSADIVNGAMERLVPQHLMKSRATKLNVAQFTVCFKSKQKFWVEDAKGRVVSGDPHQIHHCEDYWVFERPFYKSWFIRKAAPQGARWRLVEQLDTQAVHHPSEKAQADAVRNGAQRTLTVLTWITVPSVAGYAIYSLLLT